jgi:hypothetical protein
MTSSFLCEAVDGPCDGRAWFLPEIAPIWLRYAGYRHLYLPGAPGRGGATYRYAGLSEPVGEESPTWRAASRSWRSTRARLDSTPSDGTEVAVLFAPRRGR